MDETPALSGAERDVWRSFYSMRRQLDRALDLQLQRDSGLSASEFEILVAIDMAPERQLRIKEIASSIGWEKSRVSHLVTRMERRGLVSRTECASDARGSWIGLTTAGRRALLGATRGHSRTIRNYFFEVLTPQELALIDSISGRVVDAIGCGADEDAQPESESA